MTFAGLDYGELCQTRTQTALVLEYLAHTLGTEDPNAVQTAGLLGALDRERERRHQVAAVVAEAVEAREEA